MPIGIGLAVAAGATLVSGAMQSSAIKSAAQTQSDQAARSQQAVLAAGQQGAEQFAPYQAVGKTALSDLSSNMPYFTHQFNNQDLNANLAPNYGFMLDVGQRANLMNSNATGGANSGNAGTALNMFSQNYAQNAYKDAFANYTANQQNIYNRLSGTAGLGLQGATGAANAMIGTGTNVANIGTGAANAQAAGSIAQGNVAGNAISNLGNLAYLSSLGKGGPSGVTPTSGDGMAPSLGRGYTPSGSNYLTS
jgi:hypothetical protein